jgi:hypothetical protein
MMAAPERRMAVAHPRELLALQAGRRLDFFSGSYRAPNRGFARPLRNSGVGGADEGENEASASTDEEQEVRRNPKADTLSIE